MTVYREFAQIYDLIYQAQGKDYEKEACRLHAIVHHYKQSPGNALLDVACGTGEHLRYLRRFYTVEGLDSSATMLAVARRKLPDVLFHEGDMRDFDLGRRFDAIVCLFGSIGYVADEEGLHRAIACMAAHLHPGGVLVIEPWIYPQNFRHGATHAVLVDEPDMKVARVSVARRKGDCSEIEFHFLIATPAGVRHFVEHHLLGLFAPEQYGRAFERHGLELKPIDENAWPRGDLFVGVRSL